MLLILFISTVYAVPFFLTLLDQKSEAILKPVIEKFTLGRLKMSSQSCHRHLPLRTRLCSV
ncbi:BEM_collapsed_G0037500.mRNA.1.CDS.1 [Saccharomyces cerevisiae]|nr:BEM_collapsed_G0037500.mRNA.1.CDS.1 [Saccharomyces cerevisiae]